MTALSPELVAAIRAAALRHPCNVSPFSTHSNCRHTFGRWGIVLTCDADSETVARFGGPCWHLTLSLSRRWIGTTKPPVAWNERDHLDAAMIRVAAFSGLGEQDAPPEVEFAPRALHSRLRMREDEIAGLGFGRMTWRP